MQDNDDRSEWPDAIWDQSRREPEPREQLQEYDWVRKERAPTIDDLERALAILSILEEDMDDAPDKPEKPRGWVN